MTDQQHEALLLADALEDDLVDYGGQSLPRSSQKIADEAAVELRRLHAENQKLRAAIHLQTIGHDKTLDELRIAEQDVRRLHAENVELRANLKRAVSAMGDINDQT